MTRLFSRPAGHRSGRRLLAVWSTAAAVAATGGLATAPQARAATTTLSPASLTTTTGKVGSSQTAANLVAKDQSGSQDSWSKYVEFIGGYSGYRSYSLPSSVSPSTVTAVGVTVNYRGPSAADQPWTWSLYNWSTGTWTSLGTNGPTSTWDSWTTATYASSGNAADYVGSGGSIRVGLTAGNSSDAIDVDFESITVTSADTGGGTGGGSGGGTGGATSTVKLPPAKGQFSYQIGGSYTPEPGVTVVSRDRMSAPAGPNYYNICYLNLLQTQEDEDGQSSTSPPYGTVQWWKNNHPDLLLRDEQGEVIIDKEWKEALFDVSTPAKRNALFAVQSQWLSSCQAKGFQAIEPDNLDSFDRSHDLLTFAQSKEYLKLVVPEAHRLGLAVAQKNTSDTGDGYADIGKTFVDTPTGVQGFDFAIAEGCQFNKECHTYTDVYGSLVYDIEYTDENPTRKRDGVKKTVFEWACADYRASFSVILRDRDVAPFDTNGYVYSVC